MSFLTKLFNRPPAPDVIDLTIGEENGRYPIGFFRTQTESGEMGLGFFSGAPWNRTCVPCGLVVNLGSELARVPQKDGESLDAAINRLPLVRLHFKKQTPGRLSVGGHELQLTDSGDWDGETEYVGGAKATNDSLDSGLW